jgi:hypothetical protein
MGHSATPTPLTQAALRGQAACTVAQQALRSAASSGFAVRSSSVKETDLAPRIGACDHHIEVERTCLLRRCSAPRSPGPSGEPTDPTPVSLRAFPGMHTPTAGREDSRPGWLPRRANHLFFGTISPLPLIPGIAAVAADVPPVLRRANRRLATMLRTRASPEASGPKRADLFFLAQIAMARLTIRDAPSTAIR